MTPTVMQSATIPPRDVRDDAGFAGRDMRQPAREAVTNSVSRLPVFHPPGVVRLITPSEDYAMRSPSPYAAPTMLHWTGPARPAMRVTADGRLRMWMRRFVRVWARAQLHRI